MSTIDRLVFLEDSVRCLNTHYCLVFSHLQTLRVCSAMSSSEFASTSPEKIIRGFNERRHTRVIFLDVEKAFGKARRILQARLRSSSKKSSFFSSNLIDYSVSDSKSPSQSNQADVLEGSILVQIVCQRQTCSFEEKQLQTQLNKKIFFTTWRIQVNVGKCI